MNLRLYIVILSSFLFSFYFKPVFSQDILLKIEGNNFTDVDVILSLLDKDPVDLSNEYADYIIKKLNESELFDNVQVKIQENKYLILVTEYPNINKIYYVNNDRLKDEDLNNIVKELNITNLDPTKVNLFIKETKLIYESFGYNNININYSEILDQNTNTADLTFTFDEGKITKINRIIFEGNEFIKSDELRQIIKSKTKSLRNIFANNNFKNFVLENDEYLIQNYYRNKGYVDISVNTKIEYLNTNKVNIYFYISEGEIYKFSSFNFQDTNNIIDESTLELVNLKLDQSLSENNTFSFKKIIDLKSEISEIIFDSNIDYFEIKSSDKIEDRNVSIFFEIVSISPKYTNQINIVGNSRTYDYVIRRELDIAEGDAIYPNQKNDITNKLLSLGLFKSVKVSEKIIEDNKVDLIIDVEEKQTGTVSAGVSVGTLEGFSILGGLKERNFYGTGRSLEFLLNTSDNSRELTLITSDRFTPLESGKLSYNVNYKEEDLSKSSSYKLNAFKSGIGIGYKINKNLFHNFNIEYLLKDYEITNKSTVASSIANSSGENVSILIKNNFRYSTLNKGFIPKEGNYFNFNNTIETPTSSSNGYFRNVFTYKDYTNISDKNIFSIQARLGNIISLNDNDILSDDKFTLGGRWLRGFDNYGAGPRNSRTSYVGGNNLLALKLDFSREIVQDSNFPIFVNLFNDYGLLWENKTKPTNSNNTLRASAGFGIKYYSAIGPIGFSWGYPLLDEDYDIKRMFLFSIGNID